MFSVFTKAWQQQNLSPGARAFLKLVQNLLWTALIAGALAGTQYLDGVQQIDWALLERTVAVGAVIAVLNALYKYFSAQGDTPLGAAGAMATNAREMKLESLSTTAPPVNVVIHTSAPITPKATVSTPTATPDISDMQTAVSVPTVSTSPAQALRLVNSFAFGTPTQPEDLYSSDTQPHPAVGK